MRFKCIEEQKLNNDIKVGLSSLECEQFWVIILTLFCICKSYNCYKLLIMLNIQTKFLVVQSLSIAYLYVFVFILPWECFGVYPIDMLSV